MSRDEKVMNIFVLLFRGINVGGKNKVPMAELKQCLEALGFSHVITYIASGNAVVSTSLSVKEATAMVEAELPKRFRLDEEFIRVLVLPLESLKAIVKDKPLQFGDHPDRYHSDAVFLLGIDAKDALSVFDPKEGVDTVWPGKGVIYSQRVSALRTKSRLSKIVGTSAYINMTIRSWNTTLALLKLAEAADQQ